MNSIQGRAKPPRSVFISWECRRPMSRRALEGIGLFGGVDEACHLEEDGVERGHEHLVPALEVHVQRAFGDVRRFGDTGYRGTRDTVLSDHLEDGLHDLLAPLLGRQPAWLRSFG